MKSGYDQFFQKAKINATSQDDIPFDFKSNQRSKYVQSVLERREKNQKNKKKFPLMPMFSFVICLGIAFTLIEKFDDIESYISKIEIGLGEAHAESIKTDAKLDAKPESVKNEVVQAVTATADVTKAEDNSDYLFKLADRKKELDIREEDLNKKSVEIEKQKTEIESKLKELDTYREKITTMLKERISTDSAKVDTLVQVYTNMKPSQAAKIFETMDEDLVIEILSRMKKKSAADILNIVKADKAQIFSERYAGYKTKNLIKEENDR